MKSRRVIWLVTLFAGAFGAYAVWLAYLAYFDLVTMDVRNMEVRDVVKKIERQTWEDIFVDKKVEGKVTLKVRRAPLEDVLRMVAEQSSSRPTTIYPLYSNKKSLAALQETLRGETDAATCGWTNLQARGMGTPGFGGGGFGGPMMMPGTAPAQKQRVSLNITGKDLAFAILAFGRFAQTRIVPEDGTAALINLSLKNAKIPDAVAKLAKKVGRKSTKLYALQPMFGPEGFGGPGGPRPFMRDGNEPGGAQRFAFGGPEMSDEMRKQRMTLEEELKQTLPTEERQKLEQAQREREKQMQEFADMTPEQQRERMMQMAGGGASQMNANRILNSTPEQRAQMNQRMGRMRGGGRGGPPR